MPSLTPLIQAADHWSELLLLLPLLVALEAVLSADNAIALAAISRRLHDPALQRQALNLGLALALVFRLGLIAAGRWVLHFWPLQLLASLYLLWLCGRHLLGQDEDGDDEQDELPAAVGAHVAAAANVPVAGLPPLGAGALPPATAAFPSHTHPHPHHHHHAGLRSVVVTLALTDLAFSLDSVAAAVAVTDRLGLVMAGGVIGVIALRLTAELFIRWLEVFRHLETAGYLAVGLVGIRLLLRLLIPSLELPEWALLLIVAALFTWGFSVRDGAGAEPEPEPGGGG